MTFPAITPADALNVSNSQWQLTGPERPSTVMVSDSNSIVDVAVPVIVETGVITVWAGAKLADATAIGAKIIIRRLISNFRNKRVHTRQVAFERYNTLSIENIHIFSSFLQQGETLQH